MDRVLFIVVITAWLSGTASAQAEPPFTYERCVAVADQSLRIAKGDFLSPDEKAEAAKLANGIGRLWRITAPGGKVSHIWGTFHVRDPRLSQLPDQVPPIVKSARIVATEFKTFVADRAEREALLTNLALWDESIVAPGTHRSVSDRIRPWLVQRSIEIGVGRDFLHRLTPLGTLTFLLLEHPCDDFYQDIFPIQDNHIVGLAIAAGIDAIGLEPHDSLNWMNDRENREEAMLLFEEFAMSLDPVWFEKHDARSTAALLQGDVAGSMVIRRHYVDMVYGVEKSRRLFEIWDRRILANRNHVFVETAVPELSLGGVFIAVGAYHLPGDEGMIALLRAKGYRVQRVSVTGEWQDRR